MPGWKFQKVTSAVTKQRCVNIGLAEQHIEHSAGHVAVPIAAFTIEEDVMSIPTQMQLPCGCCFIIPPVVLKDISAGHKRVSPRDLKTFQDSYAATQRL
jgi:hypothetical protein